MLGYGEISLVLGWPEGDPRYACKRMPVFESRTRFEAYRQTLEDYVDALRAGGVEVVETRMRGVDREDGTVAAYVVQPVLPQESLAPSILREADPSAGHPLVEGIVDAAAAVVSPSLGLDAQLANWVWERHSLLYIDVSTPLIWDVAGRSRLDLEPLAQAYPAALRFPLRRFVAPGILDGYRDPRSVYLDLTGNLLKERLDAWLPRFLDRIADHLDPALTAEDVRRYYRSDARLWACLLLLRRLDRRWRRLTGRPYPFLLPGKIQR